MNKFDELPEDFKKRLIKNNGVYIGTIEYHSTICELYYVRGVYLEVQMTANKQMISKISLVTEKRIDKYIKRVQIDDLFSL